MLDFPEKERNALFPHKIRAMMLIILLQESVVSTTINKDSAMSHWNHGQNQTGIEGIFRFLPNNE